MRIERSFTEADISKVLYHKLALASQEDGDPVPALPMNNLIHYVLVYSDTEEIVGCYTLIPHNEVAVDIHTNFLPHGYGELARGAIPLILDYMFNVGGWDKVITEVPAFNRLAHRYVKQTGMKQEGVLTSSFLKDNTLYDVFVYGMTREEYKCQH